MGKTPFENKVFPEWEGINDIVANLVEQFGVYIGRCGPNTLQISFFPRERDSILIPDGYREKFFSRLMVFNEWLRDEVDVSGMLKKYYLQPIDEETYFLLKSDIQSSFYELQSGGVYPEDVLSIILGYYPSTLRCWNIPNELHAMGVSRGVWSDEGKIFNRKHLTISC